MTIETQQGKKSWIGDGSTTSYPYSYPFLNASDIEVYLDGNKQTSGFSVQNKTDYSTGANIIFDVAPAEGVLIVIRRNIPMTQEISYPENGEFPAESHEKSLDKLTMLIIDNNKEALKVNPATPEDFNPAFPIPEANKALKITGDGKGFTMSDYDPDTALALTEDFKNQAQQAAIDALSSQTAAANSETVATTQANIATTQANIATTQAGIATAKTSEVVESGNNALSAITDQETTSKNNVIATGNEQVARIEATGNNYDNLTHKNITNCLLEVPQRIKLELADGVLTLKAGSQVIVPNGDGVFDEIEITSDLTFGGSSINWSSTKLLVLTPNGTLFVKNGDYTSGATYTGGTYGIWYDTTNNSVKYTLNGGSTWISGYSLPLAQITTTSGIGVTSIDQVFNGMGYIGSTVWVDKGVKGLIPNGRNADGTLNNIEHTIDNILVYTNQQFSTYNGDFLVKEDGGIVYIWTEEVFDVVNMPDNNASQGYYYVSANNKMYWHPTGQDYQEMNSFKVATLFSNGSQWVSANPKLPFRAVDYNDFKYAPQIQAPYIKDTYKNGTSWYRVWSDGWCEQGSSDEITSTISETNKTVALLKKYKDANYTVNYQITTTYTAALSSAYWQIISKTTTNFVMKNDATASWHACGYLAEGEY